MGFRDCDRWPRCRNQKPGADVSGRDVYRKESISKRNEPALNYDYGQDWSASSLIFLIWRRDVLLHFYGRLGHHQGQAVTSIPAIATAGITTVAAAIAATARIRRPFAVFFLPGRDFRFVPVAFFPGFCEPSARQTPDIFVREFGRHGAAPE